MYLRISNEEKFLTDNDKNEIIFAKRRRGNIVKKFNFKNNTINHFYNDVITSQLIPKKELNNINVWPIYQVIVNNKKLTYQDIGESVHFITIKDDGTLQKVHFYDLFEGMDILTYIGVEDLDILTLDVNDEYSIETISEINVFENYNYLLDEENESIQIEGNNFSLSNYIISEEEGLIINNFYIV